MLPILLSSEWDQDLAQGLAFALGRAYPLRSLSQTSDLKPANKNFEALFHMLPNLHASITRGLNGVKVKTQFTVMQLPATVEQNARAMSAVKLASSGNGIPGRVLVVEGKPQATLITIFVDGKIVQSIDVAVTNECESMKTALTEDTTAVIFLGQFVDEIGLCWPDAVTGTRQELKIVPASSLVHHRLDTETVKKKGLFHKKETVQTEIDTPFRLLDGAKSTVSVMAFSKIKTTSGKIRKPCLGHFFDAPFVLITQNSVRVIDGDGGYFRFDFSTEKRTDWNFLAPKILDLAA